MIGDIRLANIHASDATEYLTLLTVAIEAILVDTRGWRDDGKGNGGKQWLYRRKRHGEVQEVTKGKEKLKIRKYIRNSGNVLAGLGSGVERVGQLSDDDDDKVHA
jgi:hypothetical protein